MWHIQKAVWYKLWLLNYYLNFVTVKIITFCFVYRAIPAIVDLAAIRDAVDMFGGDSRHVRPSCPVDLALDSSLQVDISRK